MVPQNVPSVDLSGMERMVGNRQQNIPFKKVSKVIMLKKSTNVHGRRHKL
jgi:hypothetical protein